MATIDDYFAISHDGFSVAGSTANAYIEEIDYQFEGVLGLLGLRKSDDSEWGYGIQCNGVECEPDVDGYYRQSVLDVEPVDPSEISEDEYYGDFKGVYERFQPRMTAVHHWLERATEHLRDAPLCYYPRLMCDEYTRKRDRKIDRRRNLMLREYKRLVDELCDELARECQDLFKGECDYAYSDEAAREWLETAC